MPGKFCPNCGSSIADNVKFCPTCGSTTGASSAPPPPQPAQQTNAAPTPPPTYNNAQSPQGNYQAPAYQQPYNNQQQQYNNYQRPAAPPQNNYQAVQPNIAAPMKVGEYLLSMIVFGLPIIGIIMMFVWSFSSSTNINKKNFARAYLIIGIIGVVLYLIFGSILVGLLSSIMSSIGGSGTYGY